MKERLRAVARLAPSLVLAGVAVYLFDWAVVQLLARMMDPVSPFSAQASGGSPGSQMSLLALSSTVLLSPVAEEYVFRSILIGKALRALRPSIAVVLSAVAFAAVHTQYYLTRLDLAALSTVFAMGIFCGVGFVKARSLLAPASIHVISNGLILLPKTQVYEFLARAGEGAVNIVLFLAILIASLWAFRYACGRFEHWRSIAPEASARAGAPNVRASST